MSIHPEGKRYSYHTTKDGISVVTEARVSDPGVAEQLESGLAKLRVLAAEQNVDLLATTDLFLEIDQDTETCSYWFADHANRTVFLVASSGYRRCQTPGFSFKASSSWVLNCFYLVKRFKLHGLEYSLEENYWVHVEMFPSTASQYSATALNELIVILLNARAGEL